MHGTINNAQYNKECTVHVLKMLDNAVSLAEHTKTLVATDWTVNLLYPYWNLPPWISFSMWLPQAWLWVSSREPIILFISSDFCIYWMCGENDLIQQFLKVGLHKPVLVTWHTHCYNRKKWLTTYSSAIGGRDSSVGIATRYGLDGPGIESWWRRDFPHPSRPALGPIQPTVQWVPGLSWG